MVNAHRTLHIGLSITWLALALAVLAPKVAEAQDRRAIVLEFSGPGAGAARGEVVRAIEAGGWNVASESEVQRAALRLSAQPGSPDVAREVGARAVVEGDVSRRGRQLRLEVRVRDASTGAQLAAETFRGRGAARMRAAVRAQLFDRVGFAMSRGRVPESARATSEPAPQAAIDVDAEPAPAPVERAPEQDAADAAGASAASPGDQLSPLWIAIGASAFSRDLSYQDDVHLALRPYDLPIGWSLRAQARWYPGAHFTQDFLANLGVDVAVGGAVGIQSRQRDGTTYPTESLDLRAGADVRIPLAPVELGVGFGYGIQTYALGAAENGNSAALPNVEYAFLRPALRARVDVGAGIYTEASFGWRVLTGTGALAEWFPRHTGTGFDLGAHLGWESDLGLGVRAGFEMQRYFFSMNSQPGDTYSVAGADDEFLAGSVDLVWRMR